MAFLLAKSAIVLKEICESDDCNAIKERINTVLKDFSRKRSRDDNIHNLYDNMRTFMHSPKYISVKDLKIAGKLLLCDDSNSEEFDHSEISSGEESGESIGEESESEEEDEEDSAEYASEEENEESVDQKESSDEEESENEEESEEETEDEDEEEIAEDKEENNEENYTDEQENIP